MKRLIHRSPVRTNALLILSSICAIAIAAYVIAPPRSAAMTTFLVNSTVDSVDATPGDGTCADSLNRCTLRAAVMEANAHVGPDTITLPAGTYNLTLGPNDDEENFDGARDDIGDLDVLNGDLTINGAGAGSTIIDGGAIDRVIEANDFAGPGAAVNLTISGVTIRNGTAISGAFGYDPPGGGIQFDGFDLSAGPTGTLTLTNCVITGNSAPSTGGGVSVIFGSLIVSGTDFTNNTSGQASGGGIAYDAGGQSPARTLQISNSTFTGNHATNTTFGNGAGVSSVGNTNVTISDSSFSGNVAGTNGGAIFADASLASNTKSFTRNKITSNSAKQGGGIFNLNGAVSATFNLIVGNTATADPTSTGYKQGATGSITSLANDWWGCNQGPTVSPCDRASGPTGFGITQWLKLNHQAIPNSILVNTSTTLQADFYTNNTGSVILPTDLVALEGRPILFNNAVLGTISGADAQISSGKANATFTAGPTGGSGSADATVDHATVTAPISINQVPSVTVNPTDQTVCEGSSVTFTAASSGFPPPTVQWQVSTNGGGSFSDIPGATSNTLTFTATASQNGNKYRAVFTNAGGSDTTTAATLTVNTAPTVSTNPTNQTVCDGATATFTAAATGSPAPTVQWQVSSGGPFTNIPGATSTTLSFTATAAQNGNQYRAVFTNSCGSTNTTAATLTVNASTATSDPADQTVCQGATANFSTTATGTGPFHYAWTVDGSAFGGDTSSISVPTGSLSIGNHTVAVTTTGTCSSASQSATLTVQETTATSDPADQTVCQGATANFSTTATGTGPFHYAWTVDGSPTGGDTASISVNTTALTVGNHTVAVTTTGTCGSASQSATLTVQAPTATSDPSDQTVCQGATANFATSASGTGPFHYAWTLDGSPTGSDTASISVNTTALSIGNHTVAVTTTGACGSASQSATLTVQEGTSATTPANQTVCPGTNANFSTTASGTGPFHYAWTLDGNPFNGDSASITVPTGSLSSGNHPVSVTVSGACGSVTKNATLTVQQSTATTDPADQTSCLGGTASFSTTASGTGPFSFVWKQGVTVITNGGLGGRATIVNGASSSTLTISNVQSGDFGTYTVETTGSCNTASQSANLTVNSTPPTIVLNGQNIELWPPNHSYHTITVGNLVSSATSCDGTVDLNSVVIDHVTSDEVENGTGDGNTNNDIVIACNRKSVQLRSERDGSGDGRVYTIYFKVTDGLGHSTTVTAKVSVPKSQNGTNAVDSGPHYTVSNATCP